MWGGMGMLGDYIGVHSTTLQWKGWENIILYNVKLINLQTTKQGVF